jgi:hypothetical protein
VRNLNKPPRYNVASIQAQQTLGGDVMQSHEEGDYVEFRDYQWLLTEKQRLEAEVERLTERLGGVRLIVTEEMYDELNTKYLEQQHELQNIALTARQILDEKIDLKEQVERLTKAGDAYSDLMDRKAMFLTDESRLMARTASLAFKDALNAAKGVQS